MTAPLGQIEKAKSEPPSFAAIRTAFLVVFVDAPRRAFEGL